MALFSSYAPPGVYTDVTTINGGQSLFGNARICVLIGEGLESFVHSNVEFHRGSSAVADDQVVSQDLTAQVTGLSRGPFYLGYYPVVNGKGTGTTSTTPTDITVTVNGIPQTVVTLNGATGAFSLQDIVPAGSSLQVTYYFKRSDTLVPAEDESFQIPSFATLDVTPDNTNILPLTLSIPGETGNLITLTLTDASLSSPPGAGVSDVLAVSGAGTNNISIELRKVNNSLRTLADLQTLVNTNIPTLNSGYLVAGAIVGTASTPALDMAAASFTGGAGPNSNTVFQVKNFPIVDGSNGGVVTTTPSYVTAQVNGSSVVVNAVDGLNGLVTLASPVAHGSTLTLKYWFNKYQNTADLLPGPGPVSTVDQVGLGPNRSDYVEGIDYVLSVDPITGLSTINWGNAAITAAGKTTAGYTPFDATVITTTLVDEKMYLRPVTGVVNGKNAEFVLQDSPVDGSGLGRVTDDPKNVLVYVGSDPYEALANPVAVIRVNGNSGKVTLFNPPTSGNVYATYYRNTMNDHTFTFAVVAAGTPNASPHGTYTITDEAGDVVPVASVGTYGGPFHVTDAAFQNTGIVWPNDFSDLVAGLGAKDETITLTFRADSSSVITPALQAGGRLPLSGNNYIAFLATTPGVAPNAITAITFTDGADTPNATAVTAATEAITVQLRDASHNVRTLGQIAALFAGGILTPGGQINAQGRVTTPAAGVILATLHGAGSTLAIGSATVTFAGGAAEVDQTKSVSFNVTSNITGGTTGTGWLGQTFVCAATGVRFTVVDPAEYASYGYTQSPSPTYAFAPGDTIQFVISSATARVTAAAPTPAVPGLRVEVSSTYGMNSGDTATVQTHNNAGQEPSVGEFYYVTYETAKTAKDMAIKLFSNPADAYKVYGQPTTANRLSLAIRLLVQNGALQFGCIQVPKQTGLPVASDQSFIAAIQSLTVALPGTTQKANVIVPLSNSDVVQQYLGRFLTTQASVRNKGEAIGFIGPNQYATPADIVALAQSIKNQRVILVADPVAAVQININGVDVEFAVSGEFMAAALAGLNVNPNNDVAQSLVTQNVVGFSRLLQKFDDPTMDLMSAAGVTPLVENNGALLVRDYLTTDPSSILTSEPTATTVTDFTRQTFRAQLFQFVGRKFLPSLTGDIQAVCNSILRGLVASDIIDAYTTPVVTQDKSDPTVCNVTVTFKPIFTLKYISVEFAIDTTL